MRVNKEARRSTKDEEPKRDSLLDLLDPAYRDDDQQTPPALRLVAEDDEDLGFDLSALSTEEGRVYTEEDFFPGGVTLADLRRRSLEQWSRNRRSVLADAPEAEDFELPPDASSQDKVRLVADAWEKALRKPRGLIEAACEFCERITDIDLVDLAVLAVGDDLKWLPEEKTWRKWDGRRWKSIGDEAVMRIIAELARWLTGPAFFDALRLQYFDALRSWQDRDDLGEVRVVLPKDSVSEVPIPEAATVAEMPTRDPGDMEIVGILLPSISNGDLFTYLTEEYGRAFIPKNPKAARLKGERLSSAQAIRNIRQLLQAELIARPEDFDCDRNLLCVENGVIDLATGHLREHRREDFITKLIPLRFDPEATCPTWMSGLSSWLPEDQHDFIQRVAGLFLTGWTHFEKFFVFRGQANSGKSTFLNTLERVLGEYASTANPRLISTLEEGTVRDDVARLKGVRLAHLSEWAPNGAVDSNAIKRIVTSQNRLTAAFKHRDEFTFTPEFTLAIDTNTRPVIRDQSRGIWRRMVVIPFENVIKNVVSGRMEARLAGEYEGILAWAVAGAARLHAEGDLAIPESIEAEVEAYRSATDPIQAFLDDATKPSKTGAMHADSLYKAYEAFCLDGGTKPWTKPAFYEALAERGLPKEKRRVNGQRIWAIGGIEKGAGYDAIRKPRKAVTKKEEPDT